MPSWCRSHTKDTLRCRWMMVPCRNCQFASCLRVRGKQGTQDTQGNWKWKDFFWNFFFPVGQLRSACLLPGPAPSSISRSVRDVVGKQHPAPTRPGQSRSTSASSAPQSAFETKRKWWKKESLGSLPHFHEEDPRRRTQASVVTRKYSSTTTNGDPTISLCHQPPLARWASKGPQTGFGFSLDTAPLGI
jgi:hypothetical protein